MNKTINELIDQETPKVENELVLVEWHSRQWAIFVGHQFGTEMMLAVGDTPDHAYTLACFELQRLMGECRDERIKLALGDADAD